MRNTFINTLTELAGREERIMLLTGDLGFMVMDPFKEQHPRRFINVGVAEQNMVALGTGLAEAGLVPFVYSIAPFAALRPFEFIRNGPVLHHLKVRIVGVGAGFDYGHAGPTHHSLEDVGVMRTQRGLTVIVPADFAQTRAALEATWDHDGPIYFSLGKNEKDQVPGLNARFGIGEVQVVREGSDAGIVVMGAVALEAVKAAEALEKDGVSCAVVVVAAPHPAPEEALAEAIGHLPLVLTAEAHAVHGGVGSLVCETVAKRGLGLRVIQRAVTQPPDGRGGGTGWFYKQLGLDAAGLAGVLKETLETARS